VEFRDIGKLFWNQTKVNFGQGIADLRFRDLLNISVFRPFLRGSEPAAPSRPIPRPGHQATTDFFC
jgi:hypothetical protein